MAIGERIRFIRNLRGMTQKYLGIKAGLPEKTADIRMAQYEAEAREPKAALVEQMASIFKSAPRPSLSLRSTPTTVSCIPSLHWKTSNT